MHDSHCKHCRVKLDWVRNLKGHWVPLTASDTIAAEVTRNPRVTIEDLRHRLGDSVQKHRCAS